MGYFKKIPVIITYYFPCSFFITPMVFRWAAKEVAGAERESRGGGGAITGNRGVGFRYTAFRGDSAKRSCKCSGAHTFKAWCAPL